jgi:hypothetical protein
MAVFTKQPIGLVGAAVTFTACAGGGDSILDPIGAVVVIRNGSGAPITVTFVTPGNLPNGDAYPDHTVSVPATTGERWIKLGPEYVNATGQCDVTYSGVTSLTMAVVSL